MKINKIIFILFFVSLFYLSHVDAALQVTAFSCNDQTGNVVVDNLASLSCQATINNPDQATATLNSVVLYPDGNWLESTSYAGSGFDTSISAGASTVASFTGLTPNVAGARAFDNINLDGAIDTFVADTNVNIIDIKTLSLSSSISSGNQNDEFSLQASVTAGGNLDSANVEISLSNCNLKSGESSSVSLGALNHNNQGSQTWNILMGNNHCGYTVTASGATGSITTSDSTTGTVTNNNPVTTTTAGSSGGSGGGGGGGEGGGTASEETTDKGFDIEFFKEEVKEITTKVLEGQSLSLSFDGATKHTITVDEVTEDSAKITVSSNPVTLTLKIGETGYIDFNEDGIRDMSITLIDILGKSVNIKIEKLEGAKILAEAETIARGKTTSTTVPSQEEGSSNVYIYIFVILLIILISVVVIFFRMKSRN